MAPFQEQEGVMTEKVEQADDQVDAEETQNETKNGQQQDLKAALEKAETERKKLEQALSKQGYELGELRKLTDSILKDGISQKKEEPVDFFADPDKAVNQKIAASPQIKELMKSANEAKQAAAILHLKSEHPDYQVIVASDEFQSWIDKSKVRKALFQAAHSHYDIDAAEELLSTWKERQGFLKKAKDDVEEETKTKLKDAKVDTGNSGVSGKKVYSRIELMRLKTSDPDKYNSLNVVKLYQEGRVK